MRKQPNSRMCFICGVKNIAGLKVSFYQNEDGSIKAYFTGKDLHQGYPGHLHGGIISGILDEVIGRIIKAIDENLWGVTVDLNVNFIKPIPIECEMTAKSRMIKDSKRYFEGKGEIYFSDGSIAAEAYGRYLKYTTKEMNFDLEKEEWRVYDEKRLEV